MYILAWKKGIAVLTAGSTKVSPDERIRLVDGNNLEIRDIQTNDAGNYVCQIATLKPREISHTVEILGKPNFRKHKIYIYSWYNVIFQSVLYIEYFELTEDISLKKNRIHNTKYEIV